MTDDAALEARDTPVLLNQRQRVPSGANRGQRSLAQGKEKPRRNGAFPKPSIGLEPMTLPYHEREEGVDLCGFPHSGELVGH
jgi:hypothetical protein